MGWNSWDAYSRTINETDVRATAAVLAQRFKSYGWQYVVIDEGWYVSHLGPNGVDDEARFAIDSHGRYVPDPSRFPSAAAGTGFRPLADDLHAMGLKLGIHILRGIPRQAVKANLPIADSPFRAADAADITEVCPWNKYNYGLDSSKPAAQAYYDSVARLYAAWGVDFIKADCIGSHPYVGGEIRLLHRAIAESGRRMILSLSPGPTPLDKRDEVATLAQMWRMSDDVWDVWSSTTQFPQGVKNQVENASRWAGAAGPGHWPDADMLPIGTFRPVAGWGEPRETRLTRDEQRTLMTLWCIVRSPLMLGGNLQLADSWTVSLLTNAELLDVDQHSIDNHPALQTGDMAVWVARPESGAGWYIAVINVSDATQTIHREWKEVGLPAVRLELRDLWEHREVGSAASLDVDLPPHAAVLYRAVVGPS